jgi:hypothetical protein
LPISAAVAATFSSFPGVDLDCHGSLNGWTDQGKINLDCQISKIVLRKVAPLILNALPL